MDVACESTIFAAGRVMTSQKDNTNDGVPSGFSHIQPVSASQFLNTPATYCFAEQKHPHLNDSLLTLAK
jgi:hypothetical protein